MTSVIIVDDDRDTLEVFSEYLRMKGVKVLGQGRNGKEAVELYQKFKPDITILDMRMPEFDGKYAIDEIKKIDSDAQIIVVTGFTEYTTEALGVAAVFYKPYNIDSILDVIMKVAV